MDQHLCSPRLENNRPYGLLHPHSSQGWGDASRLQSRMWARCGSESVAINIEQQDVRRHFHCTSLELYACQRRAVGHESTYRLELFHADMNTIRVVHPTQTLQMELFGIQLHFVYCLLTYQLNLTQPLTLTQQKVSTDSVLTVSASVNTSIPIYMQGRR